MIDDDHFRADNGYDAMRLDVGQQLVPKIVAIRHHHSVSYERRPNVMLVFEYKSMAGGENEVVPRRGSDCLPILILNK
jgi:hypothetical protein